MSDSETGVGHMGYYVMLEADTGKSSVKKSDIGWAEVAYGTRRYGWKMSLRRILSTGIGKQLLANAECNAFASSWQWGPTASQFVSPPGWPSGIFGGAFMSTKASGLKYWKPTSNGQRFRVTIDRKAAGIWPGKPYKPLTKGMSKSGGRNNSGKTTIWHRGGGNRRKYRLIDFKRLKEGMPAVVERLEHDPNRSGYIALVKYDRGEEKSPLFNYILAPQQIKQGDTVMSGPGSPVKPGNSFQLKDIPAGIKIHNIEMRPGGGGQLCRAAGTSATMLKKGQDGYAILRLPSGEQRKVLSRCRATIGVVSNPMHTNRKLGKGGIKRWMGRRPVVRGVAMNPVDHPMGGGEGKASGGRPSVTPWGKLTKGKKTRRCKRTDKFIVVPRHKAKKKR
ncbi:hypothetical protein BSKO_08162 [Bryopsis sp. KO-2023]|nr:hypothetical protein BSKO_08162 [Bryopsis sp. KO-2023]